MKETYDIDMKQLQTLRLKDVASQVLQEKIRNTYSQQRNEMLAKIEQLKTHIKEQQLKYMTILEDPTREVHNDIANMLCAVHEDLKRLHQLNEDLECLDHAFKLLNN